MQPVIGCDAHKKFSVFVSVDQQGKASRPVRVDHDRGLYCKYLRSLPPASEIALVATGHWYWIVDAMEEAGHHPHLANPFEAKRRMAKSNKTDALDARGLAILLRCGTLPESWIPPGELRDQRELLRTRMALRDLRTSLKHRIHAAIDRYGLHPEAISDLFGTKGRQYLDGDPQGTADGNSADDRHAARRHRSARREDRDHRKPHRRETQDESRDPAVAHGPGTWVLSLRPWCGWRSATSSAFRVPSTWPATRVWCRASSPAAVTFATAAPAATSTTISSGPSSKRPTCAIRMKAHRNQHIGLLYHRLYPSKGHGRAAVAVARHLAEASYWVLRKQQHYRAPQPHISG